MKSTILPVFSNISSMHRVFGDFQPSTDIQIQENVLSRTILRSGKTEIKARTFFWKPTFAPMGTVTKRYECFYDGVLVDYSLQSALIVKTYRWLNEKGLINA